MGPREWELGSSVGPAAAQLVARDQLRSSRRAGGEQWQGPAGPWVRALAWPPRYVSAVSFILDSTMLEISSALNVFCSPL